MPKRYVLLMAEAPLSEDDARGLESILGNRFGEVKVIAVDNNPRALIVKTTEPISRALRDEDGVMGPGGTKLRPTLTSGAIGKLKKRAAEASANGKIHE